MESSGTSRSRRLPRLRPLLADVRDGMAALWRPHERRSAGASATGPAASQLGDDLDELALDSPADVVVETGLTVDTFVQRVVAANGGVLKQQAFADYVNWSESRISAVLQDLEADGTIARKRLGREKVVYLPQARRSGPAGGRAAADADEHAAASPGGH